MGEEFESLKLHEESSEDDMKFIIQYNLINNKQLMQIKDVVEKYPHEYVGVIPFSKEITSDEPLNGTEYIPYGSTSLIERTCGLGWKGCYFDLNTFNYKTFTDNRDDMLNNNVLTIKDAMEFLKTQPENNLWFTRPSKDLKQFTGRVASSESCLKYFTNALLVDTSSVAQLKPDTEIVLSEPRNIDAEYRWFVIDRKVVSGSMYRNNGYLFKQRVTDKKMIDEAQTFADKWLPHDNCVMDLALVNGKVKVIEFNCLNGSGFYDNDIDAVFEAMWNYEKEKVGSAKKD